VENLLYVGTKPQVQDDGDGGGDKGEEGAHLHNDPVHHEIQRISTEQQKLGAEISGLRGDVQRGNRMHEQNNRMLLRMTEHLNLQDPPQGPQ